MPSKSVEIRMIHMLTVDSCTRGHGIEGFPSDVYSTELVPTSMLRLSSQTELEISRSISYTPPESLARDPHL